MRTTSDQASIMLYFRISVAPVALWGEDPTPPNSQAHVMVDEVNVESAAARIVKKLYADRWRIISVHRACSVGREERFRGNDLLSSLLREAENAGFAYTVEVPPGRPHEVFWEAAPPEEAATGRPE